MAITLGLSVIKVGEAATNGTMPNTDSAMTKIGKTYKDTCKISQEQSEVIEHFEEGESSPEVSFRSPKMPKLTFSIMDPDPAMLAKYVGGKESGGKWSFSGKGTVKNCAIYVEPLQGLTFSIPNGSIEATLNGDLSSKGILLVDFVVTPLAVENGEPIQSKAKG
ncbi:hypothetical protein ACILD7_02505 [Capnocytophaga canimorsus]|uniref:hypothetical protein n=1 Tax=Capnocytophaga canimorsus TaxID=28188 RepID=UPI0037D19A0A